MGQSLNPTRGRAGTDARGRAVTEAGTDGAEDIRHDFGPKLTPTRCSVCNCLTRNRGCASCSYVFCRPHYVQHRTSGCAAEEASDEDIGEQPQVLVKGNTMEFSHNFSAKNDGAIDAFYKMERKPLGEGSYGQVVTGVHKDTSATRAIKSIDKQRIKDPRRFTDEVEIQASLDHPNIVKLYEWFMDAKRYYLVMEICTGGELFDFIIEQVEKGSDFDEGVAARHMSQILGAISYLHDKRFAHRDLKPENFLLQSKAKEAPIKVIDFGLAKKFTLGESKLTTKAGTPFYVAPEVLKASKTGGYNEKCDVWSCGVLAYIMLCGYPPFYGDRDADILKSVTAMKFDFPARDWAGVTEDAKSFIRSMLCDVNNRPSASDVKEHPWLAKRRDGAAPIALSKDLGNKLKGFASKGRLKRVALTLIAQQMKEEDLAVMQAEFKALDKNNDGCLTIAEIVEGMKHLGITGFDEEALHRIDTDKSGSIDYSEFLAASLSTKRDWQKETLWAAFRTFDKDNSGSISPEELQVVLGKTDMEIKDLIDEVDANNDGMIDFDEFTAMMCK